MDKIEARKALNRIQIGCKRLQARLKNNLFVGFSLQDEIYKVGDDASDLLCYCQMAQDKQVMKECAIIPRYVFTQFVSRANKRGCNDIALLQPLNRAVSYLLEIETLYICSCFAVAESEATQYYIDKTDGLCRSKETKEVLDSTDVHGRAKCVCDFEDREKEELTGEKLSFVPVAHREKAKETFARLMADKWITETQSGYEWKKETTKALICFFADIANDKWGLRNGGKSKWKPFAELFGMNSKPFVNWKSDQMNHTGTTDPKGAECIKGYFK